jgi:hypothetical protein
MLHICTEASNRMEFNRIETAELVYTYLTARFAEAGRGYFCKPSSCHFWRYTNYFGYKMGRGLDRWKEDEYRGARGHQRARKNYQCMGQRYMGTLRRQTLHVTSRDLLGAAPPTFSDEKQTTA